MLTGKKEQQRDIATIGLKTVIAAIPGGGALAASATTTIASKMLEGIAASKV